MDYTKCAKEIFDTVGGRNNLVSAAHYATRLRLVTVDNSKIDMRKLENVDGVGIEPEEGIVAAPFDGEISTVAETRHAVGISGPCGMEVLIHVGIDTVAMKGDGFEVFVSEGDKVKAGQKLMAFDISKIKEAGYSTTTAVLLTNSDEYPDFQIVKKGQTNIMEKIFEIG